MSRSWKRVSLTGSALAAPMMCAPVLVAVLIGACSKPAAQPAPAESGKAESGKAASAAASSPAKAAPAPSPGALPIPAAYAPDRGTVDDPGLMAYCGAQSPVLPARPRMMDKLPEVEARELAKARARILQQTPDALLQSASERTTREALGDLLYTVGQRHLKDKDDALAIRYWDCAARRYGDTKSMLRLAKIAFHGAKEGEPALPGLGAPDHAAAYFWATAAVLLDACDGSRDAINTTGWPFLSELRTGQSDAKEHPFDRATVEADARAFVAAVDPTCLERAKVPN